MKVFIDCYTGNVLINSEILKILSNYFPNGFQYDPNWKMTEMHIDYQDLFTTIDHLIPIVQGGADEESNCVTISMLNNSRKSNWTLEQLEWQLHKVGDINKWDGSTNEFSKLVEKDEGLLKDGYIKKWYNATKRVLRELTI